MKFSLLLGYGLYLGLFFVMIILALVNVLPVNYLGILVVGLFVSGLLYIFFNAWRQTVKLYASRGVAPSLEVKNSEGNPLQNEKEQPEREREVEVPAV